MPTKTTSLSPTLCHQRALAQYVATESWQATLPVVGCVVAVVEHHSDGWSTVRSEGVEGCVPTSYLGEVIDDNEDPAIPFVTPLSSCDRALVKEDVAPPTLATPS